MKAALASDLRGKTLLASGFHAPARGEAKRLRGALVAIGAEGVIASVTEPGAPGFRERLAEAEAQKTLVEQPADTMLLPGLVDCHVHAPQYPQVGMALDAPLEAWLHRYTFPLEARYADLDFADRVYRRLVRDLLAAGTTTALYFGTLHVAATNRLADIAVDLGQRALIGRVAMDDREGCPDFYRDTSPDEAVEATRAVIDHIRRHPGNASGRVVPVVTPRFIPACTDAALEGLGRLAAECGCQIQTHAAESDWAQAYVRKRHGMSDAASLDRFGLLRAHTVLAHGNFLSLSDFDRIVERQAAVAHCPLSNAYFAGAVFPLRTALEKGVMVGLGTDISGGPSSSLLDSARLAVAASRMLRSGVDPRLPTEQRGTGAPAIDMIDAFHLATAGGADALGLPVGRFEAGCRFDALLVDLTANDGTIRLWDSDISDKDFLQAILYTASHTNIAAVFVDGAART